VISHAGGGGTGECYHELRTILSAKALDEVVLCHFT
jgi:hypothetical protein